MLRSTINGDDGDNSRNSEEKKKQQKRQTKILYTSSCKPVCLITHTCLHNM